MAPPPPPPPPPPAYYQDSFVDHELSKNLDSTFAFEGPEKLLEIWFWKSENDIPGHINKDQGSVDKDIDEKGVHHEGLRSIPMQSWVRILDLVNCKILSMKSCKFMDAYLLSESSLFVFPHKMILKTCGTTTTLACLKELFATVAKNLAMSVNSKEIYKIFYSRRCFMFPDKQVHVHKDWKSEVALLNEFFSSGKSYVVGNFASDDHWYLYVGGKEQEGEQQQERKAAFHPHKVVDQTFEILMTELDPQCASKFIYSRKPGQEAENEQDDLGHSLGLDTMVETELDSIFEPINVNTHLPSPSLSDLSEDDEQENGCGKRRSSVDCRSATAPTKFEFIHDAFAFTPCGYSSNSICSNVKGGYYYTLHITPESGWSYASFETNFPFNNTTYPITQVLFKILDIFKPRKFSMTLINEICDGKDKELCSDADADMDDDGDSAIGCGYPDDASNYKTLFGSDLLLRDMLGYKKLEKVVYDLQNEYSLLYMNFEKI
ncbi:SPE2 [Candida theae]|uniref:SPE2 n=1 Tax=Candida theae TaxID=1198502 RepID=A0AAD5BEG9_9ASCO|nr:SPE2 [Candida theae]KAI5957828.1 SPE2 [Candida theae]